VSLPHHEVAIVGSGFAGLGMAIECKRAGFDGFVVLERGEQLGGTWRDNHYPGCGCDVPTPLYSFSFAPNPHWSHLYARAGEIRDYMERCADRFDVRAHLRFGAEVTGAHWDDEAQRWIGFIDGEPAMTTDFIVGGFGGLNRPSYPDIEGLETFRGALFHSAQWNHDVPLEGKRIGVIGTGASAIQLIPQVARTAERVTVFQRTPPWVVPKLDRRISRVEQALYARVPLTQRLLRGAIFAITETVGIAITRYPRLLGIGEAWARWHMRRSIKDPQLRGKLTPRYRLGCKRILPSNDYYPALARDNVELETAGIARVTETGVVTGDGTEHELDVLVCASGFRIEEVFAHLDVRGRDGLTLTEAWASGIEAHRGTTVAGFPNMALLSGPNTGTGSTSQVYMIEAQIHYVLEMLRTLRGQGAAAIEPTRAAEAHYNAWLQQRMKRTVWLTGGCNSWYLSDDGVNRTLYPGPSSEFWRSLRKVNVDEYLLEPANKPAPRPAPVAA
jgi:cation diffusion facilitator CzcD-associated flavoprotein CzcO